MHSPTEDRLKEHGYELPAAPASIGSYVPVVKFGHNMIVTSGQLPFQGQTLAFVGKVGGNLSEHDGVNAARIAVLNGLAQIKASLGSLDKVRQIVRVEGYVNSAPGFHNQPFVLNGASNLLAEVYGEHGRHTRIAVGVSELPMDAAVEIVIWAEVRTID